MSKGILLLIRTALPETGSTRWLWLYRGQVNRMCCDNWHVINSTERDHLTPLTVGKHYRTFRSREKRKIRLILSQFIISGFFSYIESFLSNLILARGLLVGSLVEFGQEETQSSIGQLRFHIGLSVSLAPHTGHSLYLRHAGPKRQIQPIVQWEIIYRNLYMFISFVENNRIILSSILKNQNVVGKYELKECDISIT